MKKQQETLAEKGKKEAERPQVQKERQSAMRCRDANRLIKMGCWLACEVVKPNGRNRNGVYH